jgi:hypothetical protein
MEPTSVSSWSGDWAWSLPLIVLTVAMHAFGLRLVDRQVTRILSGNAKERFPWLTLAMIMPSTALCATILHGIEASIWAAAYFLLSALPDRQSAMLYSLSAMTSYGHAQIYLHSHWQLMGSLEALNGLILFGLTTAFLFTVMQKVWPRLDQF